MCLDFHFHRYAGLSSEPDTLNAPLLPLHKPGTPPPKNRRRIFIAAATLSFVVSLVLIQTVVVPFMRSSPHQDLDPSHSATIPSPLPTLDPKSPSSSTTHGDEEPLQEEGNKEHNPFLTMFPPRPPMDQERFLGYLPHSGFHNQRMSIETALQLAAYLNRTLLLPPLYLCDIKHYIGWKTPSILLRRWESLRRTKEDEALCRDYDPTVLPPKTQEQRKAMSKQEREREKICRHYHSWTLTPWTYFYDLPKVLEGVVGVGHQLEPIRVFDRPNMSIAWMAEQLGIQDLDKEVYWINDTSRFHVRILDDSEYDYRAHPEPIPDPNSWKGRYENTMLLSDLRARPERVIHFGSLFGIERVEARSESHQALQQYITNNLDIWNQPILDAAKHAETEIQKWIVMTGRVAPDFLGAHLRTADGGFKNVVGQSLQHIMDWLTDKVHQDKTRYPTSAASSSIIGGRQDHNEAPVVEPTFLESCMGQPLDSPLVFLATDVHRPRVSPVMSEYWQKFPCTMILSDFPGSMEILNGIRNTADNVHMLPYMTALMDAVLAAKGREFQGTENSTFTNYIIYHLWLEYHPDRPRPLPIQ